MNAKNWSLSYKGSKKQEIKQHILDTISLWGAIGLLWCSFLSIIKEFFPEYLEATVEIVNKTDFQTSYAGPPVYETYGLDWLLIGIFLFVLWLGYDWPKQYLKKWSILFHVAGLFIPIGYVVINFEKIVAGIVDLAWFYLPYWNDYYKMNLYMGVPGQEGNSVIAFTAICMIFWWLVWALTYVLKKRILLVLFPVVALSAELLVGLSPKGNGLIIALFGAILLTTLGGTSVIKKAVALACLALSLFLTGVWFEGDIKSLATTAKKQEILSLQENFSWNEFIQLIQIDLHFNWEKLGNNAPQYTGKSVLEMETNEKPVSTVYVKGFYGINYDSGNWNYDDSAFRKACREAGKSTEEVAKQIFQMPYDSWEAYEKSVITSNTLQGIEYKLRYTGTTGDVAYIPYATDYASLDESYSLMGDYLFKKSILDREITCKGQNFHYELSGWHNVNRAIENEIVEKTEEFINDLADAYLQIPEELKDFLSQESVAIEASMLSDYYGIPEDGTENNRRILYGAKVASYLSKKMAYSLKLDELPAGVDPIEYALAESHEGYCMHFASAATMLLRYGGVPARYVSGYAVDRSVFVYDAEAGVYKATVGDFMAHAWVEVYLDNIGWVPLEVTPGSSLENLPTQEDIDRWESLSEVQRDEYTDSEPTSESEETEESEEPTEETEETEDTQTEQNDPINSENTTPSESENSENQNPNGTGNGDGAVPTGQILKIVGIVGGILLLVAAIVFSVKYGLNRYRSILMHEIERNMTRKAVKRINRRMYRGLRIRNPKLWFAGKLTDVEYETALKEQYSQVCENDWEQFMDIVKKNHYSKEKITIEEMQFCFACYTKSKEK